MTTTPIDIPAALHLDHPVHRLELKRAGYTMPQIRAAEKAGHLALFRRDYFGPPAIATDADPRGQLVAAITAELRMADGGLVVARKTAAQLHGLIPAEAIHPHDYTRYETIVLHDHRPDAKVFNRSAARSYRDRRPRSTVRIEGLEVTTLARTLVDICRDPGRDDEYVVLGDRMLREGLVTAEELAAETAQLPVSEQRATRETITALDGRARTANESRSRMMLRRLGLPAPELGYQVTTYDDDRAEVILATAPFAWPASRVLGFCEEYDEYCDLTMRREDAVSDGLGDCAERLGLDAALAEAGYRVFRWTGNRIDRHTCDVCNLRRALGITVDDRHFDRGYHDDAPWHSHRPNYPYDSRYSYDY